MKNNLLRVVKMTAYYSFLGFILQVFIVNVMLAGSVEGQNLKNIKVSIDAANVSLEQAFKIIERASNLTFGYDSDEIPKDAKVTLKLENESLQTVLEGLARDYNLVFNRINNHIVVRKPKEQAEETIIAEETGSIKGRITDAKTGEPLIGANIMFKGTTIGSTTDINGIYKMENVLPSNYVIVVKYVGYRTITEEVIIQINKIVEVNFELQSTLVDLDDIIVTGSQSEREKRALSNPVTTFSAKDLEYIPISSIEDLFEGKVPSGYTLDIGFGQRHLTKTSIRGGQTFTSYNSAVKMYIDGVEIADYQYSPLATINVNEIDKIEILRGPMASTLYGSGSSGGVIQIFTKKGNRSGTKIGLKSYITTTATPYLDKTPFGHSHALSFSSGTSDYGYNFGILRSIGEQPFPNNGIKDGTWRLNGGVRTASENLNLDLQASYGSNLYGYISNPLMDVLAQERGWTKMPASQSALTDWKISSNDQRASLNLRHIIDNNWYQNITVGFNRSNNKWIQMQSSSVWIGTPPSTQVTRFPYWNMDFTKISAKYFTNTKQELGSNIIADLTGGIEYTNQTYDQIYTNTIVNAENLTGGNLDNGSVTNNGYTNTGIFGEVVLSLDNQLFLTGGLRLEDNSSYGEEFGLDKNPRVGVSYVNNFGDFQSKLRASWGKSTTAPTIAQKMYQETYYSINFANPDLGPETQSGYEVGVDLYFQDWISFELTYYNQTVENGIHNVRIDDPNTPLTEYQYRNVNEFLNKGWELAGKVNVGSFIFNFTYTITDCKYGKNANSTDVRYKEGTRKLYTPDRSGSLGINYILPQFFSDSHKGGSIGIEVSYIGTMLTDNILEIYDGYWKPGAPVISSQNPKYLTEKEGYYKVRLHGNYWIREYLSLFVDVVNLTNYQEAGIMHHIPTIGREIKVGLEFLID